MPERRVFLVGGHITKFSGKNDEMQHRNLKDLIGEAIGECLKDICEDVDVERIYVRFFFLDFTLTSLQLIRNSY